MSDKPVMSPSQGRAARAWLDWSQEDLARRANVSVNAVRDFEKGRRSPITNNIEAMERAFVAAGIRLTFDPEGKPIGLTIEAPK